MSRLATIEQRGGETSGVPWVLDGAGNRLLGCENDGRMQEVRAGLQSHSRVHGMTAEATDASVERIIRHLHEPAYLDALDRIRSSEPVLLPELSAPGLAADTPVCARLVASAREGVRTAVSAAELILAGERFTYALCRPPGHHAGPGWLGGYCYLNNAAAAAQALYEGGVRSTGILDLDLHYPNGTSAIVAEMDAVSLHSLHAWPVVNAPGHSARARCDRERLIAFPGVPKPEDYLEAVVESVRMLGESADVLVLSLGYDTVIGDPHGGWTFSPTIFEHIGGILARTGKPICVVQEGGYHLDALAECSHAFARGLLAQSSA